VISHLFKVGGDNKGDRLVSFNKRAFQSYGLQDSFNAAMDSEPVQQYVDALNHLLQNQRYDIGGAAVTYWFKEKLLPADDPFAWLHGMDTEEQQGVSALAQVRKLLAAIRNGERSDLGSNHYYGLTISGASGRVMVRDWMEGQFPVLLGHIETWFADLAVVHREGGRLAPDPKFLAVGGALVRELKDLPASTTSVLWHAALTGLPIPQPIMAQALDRFRSALVQDETFNHARMGLIKAYFVRTSTQGESPMKTNLNPEHPDPAYHCGRLLAVLAKLQHAALGDVGAGVVQRYYPAASSAPGLTLGRLIGNARNHLGKLEGALSFWYEQLIAEIMGRLGDNIPRTLNLEGQGLFALGYYQQLADLRAGRKDSKDNNESGDQK
jgi:CRISPR-associated protein Csd1